MKVEDVVLVVVATAEKDCRRVGFLDLLLCLDSAFPVNNLSSALARSRLYLFYRTVSADCEYENSGNYQLRLSTYL